MNNSRKILIGAGIIVALPLIALGALVLFFDARQLRPILQAQLQQRLHRPVSIGDLQLKIFPFSVELAGLNVSHPEGFASQYPFLQAKNVYVGVRLIPLLRKEVNVRAVRLRSPQIEIVRNPSGVWNYEPGGEGQSAGGSPDSLLLDELTIEDGQIAIHDQKTAKARDLYEHINLSLKNLGPNRRGTLAGDVRLDSMAAALQIRSNFTNAETLTANGTLRLKSDRNQDALNVTYDIAQAPADRPLVINSLVGKIGALSASATGSVDLRHSPARLQLHVQSANAPIADLLRIAALYGARFPSDIKADGLLAADVQVTGTVEKPVFAGKIDATKAEIRGRDIAEPVRASELHIDFTPDQLSTRHFTIETGGTRLTAQGTMINYASSSPQVNATLETTNARVEELLRIAQAYGIRPVGLIGTGFITVNMKISAAGKALDYSGSGSLRDLNLTSAQLPRALAIASANVTFSEDRVGFDHVRAALGSMHFDGAGSLRNFVNPDIQFVLHIDQVNSAELQQWNEESRKLPSSKQQSGTLDQFSASGTLSVGKVVYDQIVLRLNTTSPESHDESTPTCRRVSAENAVSAEISESTRGGRSCV